MPTIMVRVKRRIHVTDEENERSEDEGASVQVPMSWYKRHASTWNCYRYEEGNWKRSVLSRGTGIGGRCVPLTLHPRHEDLHPIRKTRRSQQGGEKNGLDDSKRGRAKSSRRRSACCDGRTRSQQGSCQWKIHRESRTMECLTSRTSDGKKDLVRATSPRSSSKKVEVAR